MREPSKPLLEASLRVLRARRWTLPIVIIALWCAVALAQESRLQLEVEELPTDSPAPAETTAPTAESTVAATVESTPTLEATATVETTSTAEATPTAALTPTPQATPTASAPVRVSAPRGPRVVVLVLGGVSWQDWVTLGSSTNTSTPGFRRVLEEGALAATRLPGARSNAARSTPEASGFSSAMLRAAAALSTGSFADSARSLPASAALTLGPRELLVPAAPAYESAPAALIYARRTGKIKSPSSLLNLGWGELRNNPNYGLEHFPFGALGYAVQQAGGKTVAMGSGDTFVTPERGVPLREWSLMAADPDGAINAGDVSGHLLARDRAMPFGLRTNLRAVMRSFDAVTRGEDLSLVAVEWGDTRRAARYARWCSPEIARAHRWAALARADTFLQALIGERLNAPNDRLIVLTVPDLDSAAPQWLPMVFWRPLRGSQGALLHASGIGEQPGVLPLESVHGMLLSRLPAATLTSQLNVVSPQEVGVPSPSAKRLRRLLALQAGTNWLDEARRPLHLVWAALLVIAIGLSLVSLSAADSQLSKNKLAPAARWARATWAAAMVLPLLLWLFGLCIEATWRFGALSSGSVEAQPSWKLVASLVAVAFLALWVLGTARGWFQRVRLQGVRIGLIWLLLTAIGLWIGGFALPWNALLGDSLLNMQAIAVRLGDVWALLLVSATLAGVAGLTSRRGARLPAEITPEYSDDDNVVYRRVINLRPALFWMIATLLFLLFWGRNAPVAVVASIGFSVMALRLSFERAPRATRVRWRRVMVALAVVVLLLWQRGSAPVIAQSVTAWWPFWLEQWSQWWWTIALIATAAGAIAFLTTARGVLRRYLHTRYAMRAGLSAATAAALVALILYGPMGPPLISLFTLGAVMYEVLGANTAAAATES